MDTENIRNSYDTTEHRDAERKRKPHLYPTSCLVLIVPSVTLYTISVNTPVRTQMCGDISLHLCCECCRTL